MINGYSGATNEKPPTKASRMSTPNEIEAKRQKRIQSAPESTRNILSRAIYGQATRSGAIKAQCLECVGFDRLAITECQAFACPLWQYRPYTPRGKLSGTLPASSPAV